MIAKPTESEISLVLARSIESTFSQFSSSEVGGTTIRHTPEPLNGSYFGARLIAMALEP